MIFFYRLRLICFISYILIIYGYVCGRSLRSVYCSVAGKSQDTYGKKFNIILQRVSQRPKSMAIDFEKSVENSVK